MSAAPLRVGSPIETGQTFVAILADVTTGICIIGIWLGLDLTSSLNTLPLTLTSTPYLITEVWRPRRLRPEGQLRVTFALSQGDVRTRA
ncbi:hypothetical protein V8E53_010137 [Lactarius tabidus]